MIIEIGLIDTQSGIYFMLYTIKPITATPSMMDNIVLITKHLLTEYQTREDSINYVYQILDYLNELDAYVKLTDNYIPLDINNANIIFLVKRDNCTERILLSEESSHQLILLCTDKVNELK